VVSKDSSMVMGGKILDNLLASIDFPDPGGPIKIKIGNYFIPSI
jgi:hypothetical protein